MPDKDYKGDLLAERQAGFPTGFRNVMFHLRVLRAGWGITLYFALLMVVIAGQAWIIAASGHMPPAPHPVLVPRDVLTPLLVLTAVLIATLVPSLMEQRHANDYGLRGSPWRPAATGFAVGAVLVLLMILALRAAGLLLPQAQHITPVKALKQCATWASFFALSALVEELLTRGYLQYTLTRGLAFLYRRMLGLRTGVAAGFWTAAIFTSAFFTWLYVGNTVVTHASLASVFGLGMLYCLSLWRTGNLWWALGFHTAWDFVQGYLFGLWSGGMPIRDHLWLWQPLAPVHLSGGGTGLGGSYFMGLLLVCAGLSLLLFPRHRVYPELWEAAAPRPAIETHTVPDPDRR